MSTSNNWIRIFAVIIHISSNYEPKVVKKKNVKEVNEKR